MVVVRECGSSSNPRFLSYRYRPITADAPVGLSGVSRSEAASPTTDDEESGCVGSLLITLPVSMHVFMSQIREWRVHSFMYQSLRMYLMTRIRESCTHSQTSSRSDVPPLRSSNSSHVSFMFTVGVWIFESAQVHVGVSERAGAGGGAGSLARTKPAAQGKIPS